MNGFFSPELFTPAALQISILCHAKLSFSEQALDTLQTVTPDLSMTSVVTVIFILVRSHRHLSFQNFRLPVSAPLHVQQSV